MYTHIHTHTYIHTRTYVQTWRQIHITHTHTYAHKHVPLPSKTGDQQKISNKIIAFAYFYKSCLCKLSFVCGERGKKENRNLLVNQKNDVQRECRPNKIIIQLKIGSLLLVIKPRTLISAPGLKNLLKI